MKIFIYLPSFFFSDDIYQLAIHMQLYSPMSIFEHNKAKIEISKVQYHSDFFLLVKAFYNEIIRQKKTHKCKKSACIHVNDTFR